MSLSKFTKAILENQPINVFNHGEHERDFTYIDDIVEAVIRVLDNVAAPGPGWGSNNPDPASSNAPFRLYNIGSNNPVELMRYIEILEKGLDKEVDKNFLPMQAGDVPATYADVSALIKDVAYKPSTPIEEGIEKFVAWYREFYKIWLFQFFRLLG